MLVVDDLHIVRASQGVLPKERPDILFQLCHQFIPDALVDEEVVRGHTGLAGIENLPKASRLAATLMLAVSSTIHGLLPPSSRLTGVRCLAALAITSRATVVPPVKKI